MMSIKTVNALSHYTDWTVGHVHSGALDWVGFVSMGSTLLFGAAFVWSKQKCDSMKADRSCISGWRLIRYRALHYCALDFRGDGGLDVESD
jgi:hypothetical protein